MNNVNPPSRFTAYILLHRYTQKRRQSSAEKASGYRVSASQSTTVGGFQPGAWTFSTVIPAQAGSHRTGISAPPTRNDLPDHVGSLPDRSPCETMCEQGPGRSLNPAPV